MPSDVILQIARQRFVRDKLVARLPDPTPHVKTTTAAEEPTTASLAGAKASERSAAARSSSVAGRL